MQTIQTQGSTAGSLLEKGKAGKGEGKSDAKGGVFATLVASLQKHLKQTEGNLQVAEEKLSGKEKLTLKGLVSAENAEGSGKPKASLKVAEAEKANGLLSKLLLQGKDGEENTVFSPETRVADDTDALQKNAAIGLGVFQQETRDVLMKKATNSAAEEEIFTGLKGKSNKSTEDGAKSPRLAMDTQGVADKNAASAEKNKIDGLLSGGLAAEGKNAVKQGSQSGFSLNNVNSIDDDGVDGVDVSRLIKRDAAAGLKNQQKGEAKAVSLASVAGVSDDVKAMSQETDGARQGLNSDVLQDKQAKSKRAQSGLGVSEKDAKVKQTFQAVTANRSNVASTQSQASVASVASVQGDAVIKASGGQDTNMTGDDRGMGRSAAEMLMSDGSIRDTRSARSDFAMQMAYRSAASFKPSDAMIEISKAAKDGTMRLDLMLEPATLGKIQVSLQMDANKQIQVHLLVDQQASRQVLEQQLPQLRQILSDQGLNLSGFTMDMNSQQQDGEKSSHEFAGGSGSPAQGESDFLPQQQASLRMGVNVADDGSLSILA
ncbi:MAG: flagellar hook-length control protein FliK [Mariprofundaceae bacterium]|nr:flagellar hook-length control protein FliK [Mariprofundaceae bacterium]